MFVVGEWLLAQLVLGKLVSLGTGSQTMLPAICNQHTTDERVIITISERESNDREEFPSETKYSVPQLKLYWDSHSVGWLVGYYQPEISPWYVMLKNYSQEKRKIICWGNSKEILCHFICLIPVEIHVPLNIKSVLGNRIRWFIPQEECVWWQLSKNLKQFLYSQFHTCLEFRNGTTAIKATLG